MKNYLHNHPLLHHINVVSAFLRWLKEDGESLVASAELLGGPDWAKSAKVIVDLALADKDLSVERFRLFRLHQLLHLDLVQNFESNVALRFMAINPDDPRADEARICAEAVDKGLRSLEALRENDLVAARKVA